MDKIRKIASAIDTVDKQLREKFSAMEDRPNIDSILWENTYIKRQIDKRKSGGSFSTEDHLRAMVYAMLSAGMPWKTLESSIDKATGTIPAVDVIFHGYNVEQLKNCTAADLTSALNGKHFASQYTENQMSAFINDNIPKLIAFEKKAGSIDGCYKQFTDCDPTAKNLVRTLSASGSDNKLNQLAEALTAEYLRNVGYDIAKPDRHIKRILGSSRLACSEKKEASPCEAMDIIAKIAAEAKKPVAEVDYILWLHCAKGYGDMCTKNEPKCSICPMREFCNQNKK